jgi:hypothetical protein
MATTGRHAGGPIRSLRDILGMRLKTFTVAASLAGES